MSLSLIGMAAVGKSSIGKKLAERLNYAFLDTDDVIKKNVGMPLQKIIDNYGEKQFLDFEEQAILGLDLPSYYVIATGGSVVYSTDAMNHLRKNSCVIYLNDSLENIEGRLHNVDSRGIFGLKGSLEELFNERVPMYEESADIIVDVSKYSGKVLEASDVIASKYFEYLDRKV